ncbi:SIR2 family protein [Sphingopyxis sp. OPL5]|uniref:SIR2 family NAD-dependent protein deacylase n=1 Tax=Sphingopyxis sp. OPL5 TaxID=2486273 RepID=UPI00164ED9AB|nr:SIR2 family protein [Sphingopyxis sp. OPL5]QNO26703.1 SIR2 family protein [Sphingopyxis sp. OPL5]
MQHDAIRQVGFIQQSLSQNRKQIGFFIGAGCPLSVRVNIRVEGDKTLSDPLIPDVAGLTAIIHKKLANADPVAPSSWDRIIAIAKEDGGNEKNIEFLLSQIRSLQSVAGKGVVRGMKADELRELDEKICRIISEEVNKPLPDRKSAYHNLAVWTRSVKREKPVHVFTTNYDLLAEQSLEESSAPYFDGFIGSRKAFFDLGAVEDENILPARWTRLWKIHGSLNWRLQDGKSVVRSDQKSDTESYLIYPSHLKYDQSRKMPYLAMLDRLKAFLLNPSSLLFLSGYSFGDEHINDIICRSLETNPTAHVFAFLFGPLDSSQYAQAKECGLSTPNLSVLAFDKGIIGRVEGLWTGTDEPTSFDLPEGVINTDPSTQVCELKLGDFAVLGNLLKGLAVGSENDDV